MFEIPTSIEISGQSLHIRRDGDYRMVLDCFSFLQDLELTKQERLLGCLLNFYDDFDNVIDILRINDIEPYVSQMFWFFDCGEDTSIKGPTSDHKLVNWEQDSQLIAAAVNKVAGKEIRFEPYIHWWTFMGYYTSIEEGLFSTIVSIRDKIIDNKKLEKYEREFRMKNPRYFIWDSQSLEQKEAEDAIRKLWHR